MAEYGLRITHPDKSVYTLTPDDRITRIVGSLSTGTQDGSAYVSEFNTSRGDPFFFMVPEIPPGKKFSNIEIKIVGSRIEWVFQDPPKAINYVIYYGLY